MNHEKLPKGYRRIDTIDLDKNKKDKRTVNLGAMILAVALAMLGYKLRPFDAATTELMGKAWVLMALLGVLFAHMVLHELVHGLVMYLCSRVKPRFGVKSLYAYAGSSAHFDKKSYILIALAPMVALGLVLLAAALLLPEAWFWPVHIVQIANIAGAAGDIYCSLRVARLPKEILIQDSGVDMRIYAPENQG